MDKTTTCFSESHSCGPKGTKAKDIGIACIVQCDNLDEFVRVCKHQQVIKMFSLH